MNFLKKLASIMRPGPPETPGYWINVRCNRCGEIIRARVNLYNDLSAEYDGDEITYNCRKILIGEGHCFQQVEVMMKFDSDRKLIDQVAQGGTVVSEDDLPAVQSK